MYFKSNIYVFFLVLFVFNFARSQDVDLSSPSQSVATHLKNLQEDNYDLLRASKPFILSIDSLVAQKNAIQLKQIWDSKGMYVYIDKIPQSSVYFDSLFNKHLFTVFAKEMPEIYLVKKSGNWVYSELSCDNISKIHQKTFPYGISSLLSNMPYVFTCSILGIQIWQWIALLLLLFIAYLLQWFFAKIINPLLENFISKKLNFNWAKSQNINKLSRYLAYLFVLMIISSILPMLMLPIFISKRLFVILYIFKAVFIVMILFKIVDIFMSYLGQITAKTETKMDDQLSPIIYRFLQIIIIVFALIYILQKFEINVTAIFAGLSIGGLALALASQDTVKNLIGSAMIFIDRPFQIGDYITGGGIEGTVVEVGFRTTRLRASDSSIISVPNGKVANFSLTNKGMRVLRLYHSTLGLEYGTHIDKINLFMDGLKVLIINNDKIIQENYFIGLINLGESTLDIMFRFNIDTTSFDEELVVKNDINLAVLALAEEVGVSFAFPSRTIYKA